MGDTVVQSAQWVTSQSQHVSLDLDGLSAAAARIAGGFGDINSKAAGFDTDLHFFDGGPLTAQYLLVVDALNFCFWPDGELEYEHLAGGIKASLLKDPHCIDAARLAIITGPEVRQLLGWPRDLPQQEERARLLREVGLALTQHFQGQAAELVQAAGQSAVTLVQLLAAHMPGFRDHTIYRGQQVFFYKRAQIFVGDLFGAFGGHGLGCFTDIGKLTMFADYRVPVVLRLMGVIKYEQQLADKIHKGEQIAAGSDEEVEIRAASIIAVELLKQAANKQLQQNHQQQQQAAAAPGDAQPATGSQGKAPQLLSIQLDWWLWQEGERTRSEHPHHRTWTIYY